MALLTMEEARTYLRVDSLDDYAMINSLIASAEILARDVGRVSDARWAEIIADPTPADDTELISVRAIIKTAVLYALGYLYEHREEADHHDLTITMRNLLFAVREGVV